MINVKHDQFDLKLSLKYFSTMSQPALSGMHLLSSMLDSVGVGAAIPVLKGNCQGVQNQG